MTNKPTNTASQIITDWFSHQDNINRIFVVFSCIWIILSAIIAMNVARFNSFFHFINFIGCGIIPIVLLWIWYILIHPKSKSVYICSILWAVIFFGGVAYIEVVFNLHYDLEEAWIGIGNRILKYFLPLGILPIVLAWGTRYIRNPSAPGK